MAAIPVSVDVTVNNVKEVPYKDEKGREAVSYRLMCNFDEYTFAEIRCTEEIAKTIMKRHRYILGGSVEPNPVRNSDPRPLRIDRIVKDFGYSFVGVDEDYLLAMQKYLEASRAKSSVEVADTSPETSDNTAPDTESAVEPAGTSRKTGR